MTSQMTQSGQFSIPINDNEEINYYILAFDDGVDQDSVECVHIHLISKKTNLDLSLLMT